VDADKLKKDLAELKRSRSKLQAPYRAQLDALKADGKPRNAQFKAAMDKFCKLPKDPTYAPVRKCNVRTTFHDAFIGYSRQTAADKQTHWAHVRLRNQPKTKANAKRLHGKYPISSHHDGNIWVWAGQFQVAFVTSKDEWKGRERVRDAICEFVDLDGLAAIRPR
jgi:hypothetical protein